MKELKQIFRNLADKEENGKFYFREESEGVGGGVHQPRIVFLITFNYKEKEMIIRNETGTAFTGRTTIIIPDSVKPSEFEIIPKSHFTHLFSFKKERFPIVSKDQTLIEYIHNNTAWDQLKTIAKKTGFLPIISGRYKEQGYELKTEYHLEFDDWTSVLEPLIQFKKGLFDYFESGRSNF